MATKVLCVAEKPAIAKALANALGGGDVVSKPTNYKYIWNYEIAYNSPIWRSCEMTVTSVSGHLTEIQFEPPHDKWDSDASQLFKAPTKVIVPNEAQKIASNIAKLSRKCSRLYIWTDCDREGEHIGSEVADVARQANRKIQIFRAIFNNTEPSHLREAAGRPQSLNKNEVEAVNVRRELDLRTGYAQTRLQTFLYQKSFGRDRFSSPITYGSCQFPTLGFVVEQYLRMKNHIPEKFWSLNAQVKTRDNKLIDLISDRGRITDRLVAFSHYERAMEEGNGKFKVTSVSKKPTVRYRPLPLTTVTLQKKASAYLKMSPKEVMEIAEKLYTDGFVSYPRTETDRFDESMNIKSIVEKLASRDSPWKGYAQALIDPQTAKYRKPKEGKHDDKAHPPIHPVQAANQSTFNNNLKRWKVYEFITRSFLACCSDDAKGNNTTVLLKYARETFSVQGDQILERNFLNVYPYQKWEGRILPEWKVNEEVNCTSFTLDEGATTAPQPLTEAQLVSRMDANGIGTDATMADHIQKIQDRQYAVKRGNYIEPTPLGVSLVMAYEKILTDISLTKPFLRSETEAEVSSIAAGRKGKEEVISKLLAKYEKVFKDTQRGQVELMKEAVIHMQEAAVPISSSSGR